MEQRISLKDISIDLICELSFRAINIVWITFLPKKTILPLKILFVSSQKLFIKISADAKFSLICIGISSKIIKIVCNGSLVK